MDKYPENTLQTLIEKNLVGSDAEVISSHNNLILRSPSRRIVYRIAEIATMLTREDPGNLRYSHDAAWISADVAPVTRPTSRLPHESDGFIVSSYPERRHVNWSNHDINDVSFAVSRLGNSLEHVSSAMELRTIDIPSYAQDRLDFAKVSVGGEALRSVDAVGRFFERHNAEYPFRELIEEDKGLVHGDLHATNLVCNDQGEAEIIDMDSLSIGPKTYDIASWRIRQELGDAAPVDSMVGIRRLDNGWNEDLFRSLMGWKIISSMTHAIRYEQNSYEMARKIRKLEEISLQLKSLHITTNEVNKL